jgi:hypothetical protein
MPSPAPRRQAVSFRLRRDLVVRLRQHVRDHRGRPMYMDLAGFLESAIEREIERTLLIAAGALPHDPPATTGPDAPAASDLVAGRRAAIDHANTTPSETPSCTRR